MVINVKLNGLKSMSKVRVISNSPIYKNLIGYVEDTFKSEVINTESDGIWYIVSFDDGNQYSFLSCELEFLDEVENFD